MDIITTFLVRFLVRAPGILVGLTIHEFAHGYVAWLKGDNTARSQGRLTLNPLKHLDPVGTLMLLFAPFGWAKPVPVNIRNLDNPKRDMIYVAAAGPVSNIAAAFVIGMILRFAVMPYVESNYTAVGLNAPFWSFIVGYAFIINIGLAFFNLIPVPPLDGSNIVIGLLPPQRIMGYLRVVHHLPKVFIVLLIAEFYLHISLFSRIINPLWVPFFSLWQFFIFGNDAWQYLIFGARMI